jgi:hypothetical protein
MSTHVTHSASRALAERSDRPCGQRRRRRPRPRRDGRAGHCRRPTRTHHTRPDDDAEPRALPTTRATRSTVSTLPTRSSRGTAWTPPRSRSAHSAASPWPEPASASPSASSDAATHTPAHRPDAVHRPAHRPACRHTPISASEPSGSVDTYRATNRSEAVTRGTDRHANRDRSLCNHAPGGKP